MEEELKKYQMKNLELSCRLLENLHSNKQDAERIFQGEIYRSYAKATDRAIENAQQIKRKIRNL